MRAVEPPGRAFSERLSQACRIVGGAGEWIEFTSPAGVEQAGSRLSVLAYRSARGPLGLAPAGRSLRGEFEAPIEEPLGIILGRVDHQGERSAAARRLLEPVAFRGFRKLGRTIAGAEGPHPAHPVAEHRCVDRAEIRKAADREPAEMDPNVLEPIRANAWPRSGPVLLVLSDPARQ